MTSIADVEAEVDRFFIDMTSCTKTIGTFDRPCQRERRGIAPCASVAEISEHALGLVDREGLQALTMRRLADDLKISPRTLYKRISSRNMVVRQIAAAFISRLEAGVTPQGPWRSTAMAWCVQLRESMTAHPNLTNLLDARMLGCLDSDVEDLVYLAVQEGLSRRRAANYSKALLRVTINDALAQVRGNSSGSTAESDEATAARKLLFMDAASLLIDAVQQREGSTMGMDRAEQTSLAWALADAARPCLRKESRVWLHAEIGAGDLETAILDLLHGFVRMNYALPAELIARLNAWVAGYSGSPRGTELQQLVERIPRLPSDGGTTPPSGARGGSRVPAAPEMTASQMTRNLQSRNRMDRPKAGTGTVSPPHACTAL